MDEALADVELDPEDDPWYGGDALPEDPDIVKARRDAEVLAAQNKVIKDLPLDEYDQKKLQDALDESGLWPSSFRPEGPTDTSEKWSMADTRALLCIRRNCALLPKVFGPYFFPNRGKEAAVGKWVKLMVKPHPHWDRENDEWILQAFEDHGEKFEEFRQFFDGELRAFDLELAYAFAKHKKDNPPKKARKKQAVEEVAGAMGGAGGKGKNAYVA